MQTEKLTSSNLEEKILNTLPEEKILNALKSLSEREKEILRFFLQGYDVNEIAEKLNEDVVRVQMEMNRFRAKVRYSLNFSEDTTEKDENVKREADLLLEINIVFPAEKRQRYNELYAKFQNGNMAEWERAELVELSDEFEILNAKRLEYLGELAKLRGQSLGEVIKDLGIKS